MKFCALATIQSDKPWCWLHLYIFVTAWFRFVKYILIWIVWKHFVKTVLYPPLIPLTICCEVCFWQSVGLLGWSVCQCHLSSSAPCFNWLQVNYSSKCETMLSDFSCTAMFSLCSPADRVGPSQCIKNCSEQANINMCEVCTWTIRSNPLNAEDILCEVECGVGL